MQVVVHRICSSTFSHRMEFLISVLPVLLFLAALVLLDSYKLVTLRSIIVAILFGVVSALAAWLVSLLLHGAIELDAGLYRRYGAPPLEEFLKSLYLLFLLRKGRVGFMVDAAIFGFAVGAGFSIVENVFYLQALSNSNLLVWIIRGFGTALMHGGTTAILAIISKTISDRTEAFDLRTFLPGYAIAVVIHSLYNHFLFSAVLSTVLILVILPVAMTLVFQQSEHFLRRWLRVGFDTDQELLTVLTSGSLGESPVGAYVQSLQERFSPEAVVDMICYLRLHLELTIQAKGILLMREAGFEVPPAPDAQEKFAELHSLMKSIGQTGRLAILPFLHTSGRELWQLHMLKEK
ncbi:MAG: PrsW family intramembrane metalloprotease [Ignavibacteria bacterium]|nr:PrsW family intramembrane metalloprotease [Ignavibacteria bacterium]